jgi:hypothetical protein
VHEAFSMDDCEFGASVYALSSERWALPMEPSFDTPGTRIRYQVALHEGERI